MPKLTEKEQKAMVELGFCDCRKPHGWYKQVSLQVKLYEKEEENKQLQLELSKKEEENKQLQDTIQELKSENMKEKYDGPTCEHCGDECGREVYCSLCSSTEPLWEHAKGMCCSYCCEINGYGGTHLCEFCVQARLPKECVCCGMGELRDTDNLVMACEDCERPLVNGYCEECGEVHARSNTWICIECPKD